MTDFFALSNSICDCFQYFRDTVEFRVGDDDSIVYELLCIVQNICYKNVKK